VESMQDKVDKVVTVLENIRDLLELLIESDINKHEVKLVLEDRYYEELDNK